MKKFSIIRTTALSIIVAGSISASAQSGNTNQISFSRQDIENYNYKPDTYSPEWSYIEEKNVAWKKRVWRTIDLSDKGNEMLTLTSVHPSIGNVLFNGLLNGEYKPHAAFTSDRFEQDLKAEDIQLLKDKGVTGKEVTSLQIKEDWIFLEKEQKMVVRIIAMAPVVKGDNGEDYPVFWVYYPDARPYLAKQLVAAPGTSPSTLDQVFEGRFFTSKITKTSDDLRKK